MSFGEKTLILKTYTINKALSVKWSTYDRKHKVTLAGGGCSA